MSQKLVLYPLSSLAKVFLDGIYGEPFAGGSLLKNEEFSYQVAYFADESRMELRLEVDSPLADCITVRSVGNVPSELPSFPGTDDNYLRKTPGLYPDPLFPVETPTAVAVPGRYHSLWITVKPDGKVSAGRYPVTLRFSSDEDEISESVTVYLEVIDALLPPQTLLYTEWFHADCIASYYDVEIFSEKHWELIGKFMKTAADNGMNMILTPVFTPPLDTVVGGERPTVQLVDVTKTAEGWSFGFDRLKRWCDLALASGITHFEISHFFTQWGAHWAPKVMADVNGKQEQIFGWDTEATGKEYVGFLRAFCGELDRFLKENGLADRTYFHVSDEPSSDQLESYRKTSELLSELLPGYPVIDALSDYSFCREGLVKIPIPAVNHIEPFLENHVSPLWTYYCCGQGIDVSNHFFSMPSARNRILGEQLYKYDIDGFLQWGYNFYYSALSKRTIDPYLVTDSDGAFPSGDAFMVYPGKDCVVESLRLKVFAEALQDLRAFRLLESRIGKEKVMELIESGIEPITFSHYPKEESYILRLREAVNAKIRETN